MIDKLTAVGEYIFVIKDEPVTEKGGFKIPEASIKAPNTGEIISVGSLVQDKNVKKGRKAIFNKQVGGTIELFDKEITVLNGNNQLLGIL